MSSMMGNDPIQLCEGLKQLKEEHPPLLDMLKGLLELSTDIEQEQSPAVFAELITKVKSFINVLDPHSQREEGVLFRMMEQYLGKGTGPIAVMEYEHDQAKSFIGSFLENAKQAEQMKEAEMIVNAGLIKNAYYTLVEHFAKEEKILFPMAENMLSDEEKLDLLKRINGI
ncbi:hemerythrin domain-containing protein [Bacillus sp. FJAT-29790]|nr:hemerythrin domain-containing protein [Bacillus sp. FJAT-29790]